MSLFALAVIFCLLFIIIIFYFSVAHRYNIIDKPNERSSHTIITIRGGGVIYLFASIVLLFWHPNLWMPVLGILIIGGISFIDDRMTLSGKIRISIHVIAVSILFWYLNIYELSSWLICIGLYILVIGIINAYNFMDGINGITGLYSLVILLSLQYINLNKVSFANSDVIWLPIMASIVFLFFNFRKKARCFAGDVGSITIAFWLVWLLFSLMIETNNYIYILFLAVYGIDSILTIIHRMLLKQNIFFAHRMHFYQILVNEQNMSHLTVSILYALMQLLIIVLIITSNLFWPIIVLVSLMPLILIYIILKPQLMKYRLK